MNKREESLHMPPIDAALRTHGIYTETATHVHGTTVTMTAGIMRDLGPIDPAFTIPPDLFSLDGIMTTEPPKLNPDEAAWREIERIMAKEIVVFRPFLDMDRYINGKEEVDGTDQPTRPVQCPGGTPPADAGDPGL